MGDVRPHVEERLFAKTAAELARVQQILEEFLARREEARVLDAGCGTSTHLSVRGRACVVGLDMSAAALARHPDLDERIVGDIEAHKFTAGEFDAVLCWDVLEHLRRPRAALDNVADALKPDGMIVLGLPNVLSVKGIVTKFTPYRFHVWMYRRFFGWDGSGAGDGPHPTFLRLAIAPSRVKEWARSRGFAVVYFSAYEAWSQELIRNRVGLTGRRWAAVRHVVRAVTLGSVDAARSDYVIVLRRGAERGLP